MTVRDPNGWVAWREVDRFAALAGNTFWLALLSVAVAIPIGAIGGVIVARFAIPGRNAFIGLTALGLFVLCFVGLGISFYPHIVPNSVTIWQAAGPDESLGFLLVGALVLVPLILAYTAYSYWVFRGKVDPAGGYH